MSVGNRKDKLAILFVDDDKEVVSQFKKLLPPEIGEHSIYWEFCESFDDALDRLSVHHFDLLVSDVRRGRAKKDQAITDEMNGAKDLVASILETRFCPIVLFSDGGMPPDFENTPFRKFITKGDADFQNRLLVEIENMIKTGIPTSARKIHNAIDRYSGSYLWSFLEKNWGKLAKPAVDSDQIERIIMRRAALILNRLKYDADGQEERTDAHSADYYIYPAINVNYRLGEIVQNKKSNEFFVILTPHCHLLIQQGQTAPRAEYVLLVHTQAARSVLAGKSHDKILKEVATHIRIQGSGNTGKPEGRYSFLPGFLDIPDMYCDLLRIAHVSYSDLKNDYNRIAVLDAPYAEALQLQMAQFYSSVGTPNLVVGHFSHLAGENPPTPQGG